MSYEAKNFSHLLGTEGFSDALLQNHFTLYDGYVKNTNTLLSTLETMTERTPETAELQRRLGWEWNGMRMHELYFENMTKDTARLSDEKLTAALTTEFGSVEAWKAQFLAIGSMRGIGWVVLTKDKATNRLINLWINEHDVGHLVGTVPLLVMDVFEHAFVLDYGLKKADYISAFIRHIDYTVVSRRFHGE